MSCGFIVIDMKSYPCHVVESIIQSHFYKIIFSFHDHLEECSPKCSHEHHLWRVEFQVVCMYFCLGGGGRVRKLELGVNKCSDIRYTQGNVCPPKCILESPLHLWKGPVHCPLSMSPRKLIGLDDQIYTWLWAPRQPKQRGQGAPTTYL